MRRVLLTRKSKLESSLNDILTGALNRRAWQEERQWASWVDGGGRWASLVNLDHLKHFNDHQGLPMGDEAIRLVGSLSILHSSLNIRYSPVFRVSGEEFLILWSTETQAKVAERSERLRLAVETSQTGLTITVVSTPVHTTDQPDVLLNRLRTLMADAKAGGRNRAVLDPAVMP